MSCLLAVTSVKPVADVPFGRMLRRRGSDDIVVGECSAVINVGDLSDAVFQADELHVIKNAPQAPWMNVCC